MTYGFGRLAAPDPRDEAYPVRACITAPSPLNHRYWFSGGWWGDQKTAPQCVAYAWCHWLEDGPVTQGGDAPIIAPSELYRLAQEQDEWPGEDYDGTSVRAGAKVLQGKGFIPAYYWATTLEEVVQSILQLGPMVVGTNWYTSMMDPDAAGFLDISGSVAGGHAYLLDGVNRKRGLFRVKNSWGRSWGNHGFALLDFDDFERLLLEDGEACIAHEVKV